MLHEWLDVFKGSLPTLAIQSDLERLDSARRHLLDQLKPPSTYPPSTLSLTHPSKPPLKHPTNCQSAERFDVQKIRSKSATSKFFVVIVAARVREG